MNIRFIYLDLDGIHQVAEGYTETSGATIERLLSDGCIIVKVEQDPSA